MKFIPLHTRNTAIIYKNALCSSASIVVMVFVVLSVMVPVLLVSLLSPYSGIAESRIAFEQPRLQFKFQNLFVGETEVDGEGLEGGGLGESEADAEGADKTYGKAGLVACSSFSQFNSRLQPYSGSCESTNYWTDDLDHDTIIDRAHFRLQLDSSAIPGRLYSFDLALIFQAKLKHKCNLSPPALLTHRITFPAHSRLRSGTILLKGELQLKQSIEFTCPFPGRNAKTQFRDVISEIGSSHIDHDLGDMQQFQIESLLQRIKANPAYFQLEVRETYLRRASVSEESLSVQLDLDVLQVPVRYHLSVWERLGQFWLYFASFFGVSFYVMNKVKDFLFGRHIIRSWEIIPWKKLY